MGFLKKIMRFFQWIPLGSVPEVDAVELAAAIREKKNVQIIDVRTRSEWESNHIVGAVSVPITQLKKKATSLPFQKNVLVVAICLSAHRSIPAVRVLRRLGYQNVKQLKGGMRSWHHLNGNQFLESSNVEIV